MLSRFTARLCAVLIAASCAAGVFVEPAAAAGNYLDAAFSGDGTLRLDFGSSQFQLTGDRSNAVAVQTDGKIVVVGQTVDLLGNENFGVVRLNADGTLDASFDGDGKVVTDFSDNSDSAHAVAIQTDGKIIVAGTSRNAAGEQEFAVARYTVNGALDTNFSTDGKQTVNFNLTQESSGVLAVAIAPGNGDIVLAGYAFGSSSTSNRAVARLTSAGALDTDFDGDGKLTLFGAEVNGAAVLSSGKILLSGYSTGGFGGAQFTISRLNANGSFDTTFGGSGTVGTNFGTNNSTLDAAYRFTRLANGKLLVVGTSILASNLEWRVAVARYNTDGSLDTTFDADGLLTYDLVGTNKERAVAVGVQSDNKIIVVCAEDPNQATPALTKFTLLRFDAAGAIDPTYGTNGVLETQFTGTDLSTAAAIAIQPDDKAVVAGFARRTNGNHDFAVARFTPAVPTAASVSVSGRVTTADGRGINNAQITLTGENGETRTALTGAFGFYRFDDVSAGETYVLTVRAKRFSFTPDTQVLTIFEALEDVDFTADKSPEK